MAVLHMATNQRKPATESGDSVQMNDVDGMEMRTVNQSGNVYLGREHSGREVKIVYRFETEAETDDSESEDTEN